ncbi:cache domain-containing protein [Ramlibacter sp. AW1]|uniref:histidine kinase n=1 Tax=Ramlibacter aurantiacus TaxID=2801330 RepID=A0A937D2V7_9BURK|nr:cache domain-containing protein [Ramlibacter aurantiacus]MBL0420110.1 cache domain-containing protein [Ramlibacter aurantiacus]
MVRRLIPGRAVHWLAQSVRRKLLAMALLPLVVVLPLLVAVLVLWAERAYDGLLISKVRSDLAVAHGYFDQVVAEVGGGTESVAQSHALHRLMARGETAGVSELLARQRQELGLDFLTLAAPGDPGWAGQSAGGRAARLAVIDGVHVARVAPHLAERIRVPLVSTRNAAPTARTVEDRALVVLATSPVRDEAGQTVALLRGGLLLNQNLPFIDHINHIVYPEGTLPFGSQGTATLFLDDVRVTTNVRLFQDQRAIGTRVSQAVRDAVLERGGSWFDRAFVVNDWYVSAYEPLVDGHGERVGMLYVGFLEQPFRLVKWGVLGGIGLLFLVTMAGAAFLSLRLARSIFEPVERMNRTIERVEGGDSAARVGPLASRDEVGSLAQHLDHLLDVVAQNTHSLQRWAAELDHKVAERTRELAASNASLVQAQQQLLKSEKLATIGQLTAGVAHEINNPIAVIQGNLDLLRETLGEHARPVLPELDLLDQQVQRMRLIVTQLLQYARPTDYAGYVEALDAGKVFDECLMLARHRLEQSQVVVERNYHARAAVGFNRQELQQVLLNLLINAMQAMPEGGRLVLRTRDEAQAVVLEVQDNGPGLPAGDPRELFQAFVTTRPEGHGLGLWISQGLVERYGGRIEAGPAPGGGALFRVRLLREADVAAQAAGPNAIL